MYTDRLSAILMMNTTLFLQSVVVGLDDKKVPIKVAKGCYEANLTLAGLVMQRIQSDDQASEVQSTCSGADATQVSRPTPP